MQITKEPSELGMFNQPDNMSGKDYNRKLLEKLAEQQGIATSEVFFTTRITYADIVAARAAMIAED